MALTPAQATLIAKAVERLAKMIREDASARYDLNAAWSLPPLKWQAWKRNQTFDNGLLRIAPSPNFPGYVDITIFPFKSTRTRNILDGATLAPDNPKWGVLAAACLHDVIYYCFEELERESVWAFRSMIPFCAACSLRSPSPSLYRSRLRVAPLSPSRVPATMEPSFTARK